MCYEIITVKQLHLEFYRHVAVSGGMWRHVAVSGGMWRYVAPRCGTWRQVVPHILWNDVAKCGGLWFKCWHNMVLCGLKKIPHLRYSDTIFSLWKCGIFF